MAGDNGAKLRKNAPSQEKMFLIPASIKPLKKLFD